jgi:hypothetical protein
MPIYAHIRTMVGASPEFSEECVARSAAMNAYLSLTAAPSRSTHWLFQECILHFEFAVAAFEFAQPRPLG